MLDTRIIYTQCMYNCLYHVSSVGKAVSLLDASRLVMIRLLQPTRVYNVYIMCIYPNCHVTPSK